MRAVGIDKVREGGRENENLWKETKLRRYVLNRGENFTERISRDVSKPAGILPALPERANETYNVLKCASKIFAFPRASKRTGVFSRSIARYLNFDPSRGISRKEGSML